MAANFLKNSFVSIKSSLTNLIFELIENEINVKEFLLSIWV